jgi:hypothetical protein
VVSVMTRSQTKEPQYSCTHVIGDWVNPKDFLNAVAKRNICCIAVASVTVF